jgi:hypothetical protein
MYYRLVVFLGVFCVFGYLLAHGVSSAVSISLKKEHDINCIRALLDHSAASYPIMFNMLYAFFIIFGVIAGFQGGCWISGWIWVSILLLVIIVVLMMAFGGDLYEATLNPTSLLGGTIPFEQATLQYKIVIQQNDGDTSLRTQVIADIVVQACGRVTASCSSYTDERTCIANGCNWVSIPGTVPIYECRNP